MKSIVVLVVLVAAASTVWAEAVRVCYNYGCLAEAAAEFDEPQLQRVSSRLAAADDAADERAALSVVVGWLLGWAGQQTPIGSDRGGNYADEAVYGRMDCIDHSTTTTRLLRLIERRGWLRFHRVLEPALRTRFVVFFHYSALVEELPREGGEDAPTVEPGRYVVDSWFRDNGRPAVILPLASWLAGEGEEESAGAGVVGQPTLGSWSGR